MSKKLFIQTLGCAMNVRDSEHMIAELEAKEGYTLTDDPKEADLILINTCSVREKPERKLFSEIGQFSKEKKEEAKIGVCGCTASHLGSEILKKAPSVSFVLGARNVSKISRVIHQEKAVEVATDYDDSSYVFAAGSRNDYKAMVNISIGCDKKCAYCIVPHTRGQEISVPSDLILGEARRLASAGVKEVLLLGQNVNHYGRRFSSAHPKISFTELLRELSQVEGIERLRFTSPHPLHMDDEFLEEFASNPKICKSIHMPLQSGSTRILSLMRRGYSQEWFINRVERLKALAPETTIGTDIIVGFPGESEEDFLGTMEVLERVRFETLYSFVYSPRPHTEAASWENLVDEEVAGERLHRLQARHKEILEELNQKEVGAIHSVLWEHQRRDEGWCEGRTDTGKMVRMKGGEEFLGRITPVRIKEAYRAFLIGEPL
ncbi:tRNA (N6-isopentenyl adenosine(37)-C2)-methylthiotransferase MiaB [Wolinella succinogenes]|uniref:tRNA (N6-isopentenyl adenosine(37)-C2)-methylthiotransferase MiaB n=1 Tax=Wolinella succinogenes TaxID=844 RepID=UPI00240A75DF|nr:tRNA (N6-isopentenyl adenosine(37)-C2)-methylthiotransferase MiaB [Wolinella succinogenes]